MKPQEYFNEQIQKFEANYKDVEKEIGLHILIGGMGGSESRAFSHRREKAIRKMIRTGKPLSMYKLFKNIFEAEEMENNSQKWQFIDTILLKMNTLSDLSDKYDYTKAAYSWYTVDKIQAIIHFVKKYGNRKVQKYLNMEKLTEGDVKNERD